MSIATMRRKRKPILAADFVFYALACTFFTVFGVLCIYPFYYLLVCTVSDSHLVQIGQIIMWPKGIHLDNYVQVLKVEGLLDAAQITILRTVIGTFASVICTTYMAYFFTKEHMWRRKFWYRLVIVTMYFSAGLIPGYLNNRMLGLLNTFWIYIIPGLIQVYNMILVKTSIEALPPELEESAYLDGAGYIKRLFSIVIPLQKPILATICLFAAVGHWNDFFTTKLNITNPRLYTLQFKLYEMLEQVTAISLQIENTNIGQDQMTGISPTAIRMTLTAVVVIPIMAVYPFIQKYYVKGIMIGAVKG